MHQIVAKLIRRLLRELVARQHIHRTVAPRLLGQHRIRNGEEVVHRRRIFRAEFKLERPVQHSEAVVDAVENGIPDRPDPIARGKDRCLFAKRIRRAIIRRSRRKQCDDWVPRTVQHDRLIIGQPAEERPPRNRQRVCDPVACSRRDSLMIDGFELIVGCV